MLPRRDAINRQMTWQYELIILGRRWFRKLWYLFVPLLLAGFALNPTSDFGIQPIVAFAALLFFDLLLTLSARLTLSFVDKDKRP